MLRSENTVKSCAIKSPLVVLNELKLNAYITRQAELKKSKTFKKTEFESENEIGCLK